LDSSLRGQKACSGSGSLTHGCSLPPPIPPPPAPADLKRANSAAARELVSLLPRAGTRFTPDQRTQMLRFDSLPSPTDQSRYKTQNEHQRSGQPASRSAAAQETSVTETLNCSGVNKAVLF